MEFIKRIEFETGEEERAFLQRRVSFYALVSFGIVATFFVLDVVAWFLLAPYLDTAALWPHQLHGLGMEIAIALGLLAASAIARRGRWNVIPLFLFDALITLLACSAFSLMIYRAPPIRVSIEFMIFLAIQSMLFVHAAFVPAPPLRTFLLHTAAGVPLMVVTYDRAQALTVHDPVEKWSTFAAIAGWTVCFAVVGAMLSKVLFRLRLRARTAMRLGQYRLEEKLGEGGMGVVYRARHALLRRPTAIKLLPRHKAGEKAIGRFEREVRNTSRLSHPNTVAIYDYGRTPDGLFYYAMEMLEGPNLAQVIAMDGPMPARRVLHVVQQCAGALAEAHDMGLVHRDVKPENIVLCRRGGVPDMVKVVDFGLVKDLATQDDVKLSRTDTLTGTPLYIAPEAITAPDTLDGRADLYALGGVTWFLLTGRPPFEGASVIEVCAKQLEQAPEPPSRVVDGVPGDLEAIVLRLLEKKPEARFQTAAELEEALQTCKDANTWTRKDAEAWWSERGLEVEAVMHSHRSTVLTIDVDPARDS
ncbi:MAG: serine/threonine-protein kinase [Myxococcota bacterium]